MWLFFELALCELVAHRHIHQGKPQGEQEQPTAEPLLAPGYTHNTFLGLENVQKTDRFVDYTTYNSTYIVIPPSFLTTRSSSPILPP